MYSTDPTQKPCPGSCRLLYCSHAATRARSYRSYRSYRSGIICSARLESFCGDRSSVLCMKYSSTWSAFYLVYIRLSPFRLSIANLLNRFSVLFFIPGPRPPVFVEQARWRGCRGGSSRTETSSPPRRWRGSRRWELLAHYFESEVCFAGNDGKCVAEKWTS